MNKTNKIKLIEDACKLHVPSITAPFFGCEGYWGKTKDHPCVVIAPGKLSDKHIGILLAGDGFLNDRTLEIPLAEFRATGRIVRLSDVILMIVYATNDRFHPTQLINLCDPTVPVGWASGNDNLDMQREATLDHIIKMMPKPKEEEAKAK